MGAAPSTPRGGARPQDTAENLMAAFVGEKPYPLSSDFWNQLLDLPLTLQWPQDRVLQACQLFVREMFAQETKSSEQWEFKDSIDLDDQVDYMFQLLGTEQSTVEHCPTQIVLDSPLLSSTIIARHISCYSYQQRVPSYLQSMLLATDRLGVAHLLAMARYSTLCQSCATGGAMPALAQLVSSSYHAAMSSSTLAHSSSQEDNMHKRKRSSPL